MVFDNQYYSGMMEKTYFGVYYQFAKDRHEVWIVDVGNACVTADTKDEAMADITSQLSACLKDYTDTGKALPPASSKAEAMDKAADMLRDAQLEMPELYPQPIAQHMTIVTCELTDGSDRWGGRGGGWARVCTGVGAES